MVEILFGLIRVLREGNWMLIIAPSKDGDTIDVRITF